MVLSPPVAETPGFTPEDRGNSTKSPRGTV